MGGVHKSLKSLSIIETEKKELTQNVFFRCFPTRRGKRGGGDSSFAFHFNILKAFPVLSYDSVLINN